MGGQEERGKEKVGLPSEMETYIMDQVRRQQPKYETLNRLLDQRFRVDQESARQSLMGFVQWYQ